MSDTITAQSFWNEGMKYAGRSENAQPTFVNKKRFKSLFGTTPGICVHLWSETSVMLPNGAQFFHLLWGLLFLTVYANERVLSALVGGVDEKTFRKWQWAVVSSISLLKPEVINMRNRFMKQNGSICLLCVDGTDCRVNNPGRFWTGWFSHKFKKAGLRYEVANCIQTGWICWVKGPFAAGAWPDISIFRGWLKKELLPGELIEADAGYRGDEKVRAPEDCTTLGDYEMKFNARARQETANERLKNFKVLATDFRHDLSKHEDCFFACAVITQLNLQTVEPLFGIDYRIYN